MKKTLLALCVFMGFGTMFAQDPGTKENPLTVDAFIELGKPEAAVADTYVKGYIVGFVDGASISTGAHFSNQNVSSASNILLASSSKEDDVAYCIPVQFVSKSDVRAALNLQDNPQNLGAQVILCGSREAYFGVPGLKSPSSYEWVGGAPVSGSVVTELNEQFAAIPDTWTLAKLSGDKDFYATAYNGTTYAAATGYKGTEPPYDQWLISPAIDIEKCADKNLTFKTQVNGYGSTTSVFETYVLTSNDPATAEKTKLNANYAVAPESGYSSWAESGNIDLSSYKGNIYVGFRYYATEDANYATWCVTDVKLNASEAPEPVEKTYTVAEIIALGADYKEAGQKVKGYIVGYVPGQVYADAVFGVTGEVSKTNLVLADAATETDVTKCIPVQLPSGAVRNALNLSENPENLGKEVTLTGNIEKYFGVPGFKSVTAYELGEGGTPVTPPAEGTTYNKVSSIEAGKTYAIATTGKAALNLEATKTYGYLQVSDVTAGDSFTTSAAVEFTFESAGTDTYYIKDAAGRYYFQKGSYNSFNVADMVTDVPEEGFAWTVEFTAEGVKITNVLVGKTIQYDEGYNSYGSYAEITHTLPALYAPATTGVETVEEVNAPVEYFNLQGVRVANPEQGIYIVRKGNSVKKVMVK